MASLDPPRWQRTREIFDAVADLDPAARPARLAALCAGDEALLHEVESLLTHDRSSDDALGRVVEEAARGAADAASVTGPGKTLLHYRITGPIGEGGMGIVWRALDETLGRDVAIKVLPPGVGDDPRRLARFEREAKVLASLNHSNIGAIFSLHQVDGVRFLAMEYVPGEDLAARLLRGPIPLDEALRIARQIADALEEAHEQGVVHRDLKPANVKLTPAGRVKVLDFGLAKAFSESPTADPGTSTSSDSALAQLTTREGVLLGTAAYMPPEQARGLSVDKRADIWAFGAVLYEMLTGARPFAGAAVVDVLAAVVATEPDWTRLPPGTPLAVERLLRRCLQKDARQRLRDIGDARIELEHLLTASGDAGVPVTSGKTVTSLAGAAGRRMWWREAAVFAAGALVAGLVAWRLTVVPTAPAAIERLNIDVPSGTQLVDTVGAVRQSLALSSDGTRLVFLVRERDGRRQLYLRRLDRVEAEPVAGAEGGDMPFLSPDGQWLGFAADGKLKKVLLSGGQPVVICDAPEPRGASWGGDGTIVFAAGVRGGLSRVSAAGGTPTAFTTLDPARGESSHRWPLVLPGSRGVVFNVEPVDNTDDQRDIDMVDVMTGERRTLVRNGTYARYTAGALLYGQAGSLYALPFDAARLTVTGPAAPVLGDVRMDLAATGRVFADVALSGALAYVPGFPRPGVRRLVWMDREGVATPVTTETRAYRGGRLSPDGRSLAVTIQDAGNTALWLFDLGRRTWNRLTTEGEAVTPSWTPDSRRILFSANLRNGAGIHVVPADGSAPPSPIAAAGTQLIDMPEVQPDGRQALVALQDASGDDIYRLSLDGRATLEPVVTGLGSQVSPARSPSGRFLAYSSNESGRREIFVRAMTGEEQKWTVSVAGGSTPRWRQDERELFYVEGTRLMVVSVAPAGMPSFGTPRALFDEPGLTASATDLGRYDVTPDGQRFLVVQPEAWEIAPLSIVVVPRFGRELTARLPR
ncbi:MAG: serine/threonine-protein kinase [Acidobacteria bacterium]|nr:serine/threonine-protein kinase [Acidobacteriota bacterium]